MGTVTMVCRLAFGYWLCAIVRALRRVLVKFGFHLQFPSHGPTHLVTRAAAWLFEVAVARINTPEPLGPVESHSLTKLSHCNSLLGLQTEELAS